MHASTPTRRLARIAAFALMLAAPAALAQTAPAGDLAAALTHARVVTAADGSERLEPAPRTAPGEVIEYRAAYANRGKAPVRGVEASIPVPPGTEYVPGSARPANVLATTGDGRYAAVPLKRRVQGADGRTLEEDVPAAEYRALRWQVGEIAAGAERGVLARMRVIPVASPSPTGAQGGGR